MRSIRAPHLLPATLVLLLVAACGSGGSSGSPAPSAAPSAAPSSAVSTPQAAVEVVRARTPLFDGIGPLDASTIGQSEWWEAPETKAKDGFVVSFIIGWGDCQAGCIDRHTWIWTVMADGSVSFTGENGSPLTEGVLAARKAAATAIGVGGVVGAGPTCPVERPGDPACAPRMVSGAVLVVQDGTGKEIARFTTDASGLFRIALQPGDYTLVPQPVEGLMGGAQPVPFTVAAGAMTWADVSYDTGIR